MKRLLSKTAGQVLIVLALVGAIFWYFTRSSQGGVRYLTAAVTQGPVVRAVSATGTVNPVTIVQVGSYVSGPIVALYADFNSPVKQGQLIAKIDPRPFQVKVDESTAALANSRAQLGKDQANLAYQKITYQRDQQLGKENVVSRDTVDSAFNVWKQAEAQVALDKAAIQQAQANLKDAQVNLNYTDIVSPVDGTIVSRNVDVGQTVAASFQTPTLFLIAKDLTKMQVDTNVSESDIGNVRIGEHAQFTVDAYGDRQFDGIVGQVRQAPITVQNVVTYDVVVEVANPEFELKPGMTANVTIVTARTDDAVRIPADAIRFHPKNVARAKSPVAGNSQLTGNSATVWVPDGAGVQKVTLTVGLNDGVWVQMINGPLKPGDQVVTEELRDGTAAATPPPSGMHFPH
jgi:HlyD family secretion protein